MSLSKVFFTGALLNFAALGLLSKSEQFEVSIVGWMHAAIIPGIILLVVNFLALPLIFHSREKLVVHQQNAQEVRKVLGDMQPAEWHAVIVLVLFALTAYTISSHQIQIAWLSLFFFFALSGLRILKISDWAVHTDWSFLLFICMGIGIANGMNHLKMDELMKPILSKCISGIEGNRVYILTLVMAATLGLRLVMQMGPAFFTMMLILMPLAELTGITTWVMAFTILMMCDVVFFPYQDEYRIALDNFSKYTPSFNQKLFWQYNMIINIARIISIYLSIPYWRYLGML
jgi:divalent anion:Na+ symporter, DASS family